MAKKYIVMVGEDGIEFDDVTGEDQDVIESIVNDLIYTVNGVKGVYPIKTNTSPEKLKRAFRNPLEGWKDRVGELYRPIVLTENSGLKKMDSHWIYKYHVAYQLAEELADDFDHSHFIYDKEDLLKLYDSLDFNKVERQDREVYILHMTGLSKSLRSTSQISIKLSQLFSCVRSQRIQFIMIVDKEHSSVNSALNLPYILKEDIQNIINVHGVLPKEDVIFCSDMLFDFISLYNAEQVRGFSDYFHSLPQSSVYDISDNQIHLLDSLRVKPSFFKVVETEEFKTFKEQHSKIFPKG